MVPRLFKEMKKILSRDVFQKKKQEGRCLQGAMQSDNIRVQLK